MTNLVFSIISFLQARSERSEKGEVAIEYVLVGGLAAVAIVAAMLAFGTSVDGWFDTITGNVTDSGISGTSSAG